MSVFLITCSIFIIMFIISLLFKKKKEIFQIESGFQNIEKTSFKSFSINFFFILIIFIIFDLELMFGLPLISKCNFMFMLISSIFILLTLLFDWIMNKIIWKN